MFTLDSKAVTPLVSQIVDGFRLAIQSGSLRPGAKAPSIRQFAHAQGVSVYTVVDAYDRLVALGFFASRPHSGFFVRQREALARLSSTDQTPVESVNHSFDSMWYLRRVFENRALRMKPGCGWIPGEWLFQEGLRRSLRSLAASNVELGGYGEPKGYPPLRQMVRDLLAEQEIAVSTDQVLLTHGSSQGLDLVARCLVRVGDVVLVDDPGYPNLLFSLRFLGAKLIGVPRTPQGYDLVALEALVVQHQPKVFFTHPRLQSPTGSVANLAHLHRVLQLAETHGITLVENDIYADLDPELRASLASLDQLQRVVYISSFSKTISPNLRVGFMAAPPDLLEDFAQLKMISGLTSSEFSERLVLGALQDGRWRKHLRSLRERLADAHQRVAQALENQGFELFAEPKAGLFLWAHHPDIQNAAELAYKAAEQDISLGPGHLFTPHLKPSPWLRFNVAYTDEPQVFAFLKEQTQPG
jgi:DNA-binding transcriptional MocR family regulator